MARHRLCVRYNKSGCWRICDAWPGPLVRRLNDTHCGHGSTDMRQAQPGAHHQSAGLPLLTSNIRLHGIADCQQQARDRPQCPTQPTGRSFGICEGRCASATPWQGAAILIIRCSQELHLEQILRPAARQPQTASSLLQRGQAACSSCSDRLAVTRCHRRAPTTSQSTPVATGEHPPVPDPVRMTMLLLEAPPEK